MELAYDLQSAYRLFDTRTDETRYVGISSDPHRRYGQHLADRSKCEKVEWILDMQRDGLLPGLGILETGMTPVIAGEREKYWIKHYLDQGARLTNRHIWSPISQGHIPAWEDKPTYTLEELICNLPMRLIDLSNECKIHEATIKNIRQGRATKPWIASKLMSGLTKIYRRPLSLDNVTGIKIDRSHDLRRKKG